MKWVKITVHTARGGLEPVCARLQALGHDALEIEDWDDFRDFVDNRKPYWQLVEAGLADTLRDVYRVSLYTADETVSAAGVSAALADAFGESGGLPGFTVTESVSDEADWLDNWKQYYKPIAVGRRVLIQPEWEPLDEALAEGRAVFWCEPGVSFGTGSHATTYLCLELLDEWLAPGMRVADLGCGSGILSVTALLLGAAQAAAIDIDPLAVGAARRNAERNGHPGMTALRADLLDGEIWGTLGAASFDLVCANIVTDMILALAPRVAALLRPGGRLFASGILEGDAGGVTGALEACGLASGGVKTRDGWAALHLYKK